MNEARDVTGEVRLHLAHWCAGRDRAWTKRRIARTLGVPPREVEAAVQALRTAGEPICSDATGYWVTDDPVEVSAQVEALRGRIRTQFRTWRAMRRTAGRMRLLPGGQRSLF